MKQTALFFAAATWLACAASSWAQTPAAPAPKPPTLFPFVLPWDDASSGTITDVSFLNVKPAGAHGYVVAKNGHFVETNTNARVRFLGVNFAAKDAFPSHADAAKVAARIAKLGINLVRLHHMDNSDWGQEASIWDYSYKDRQHLSAAQLDKLDYFISQLKRNGVYVNLNLHVSRQFSEADGFPASVSQISTSFDKRVDEFDRRMILLQKNYARDLLTHVNPYTHLAYNADPAVLVVEINNENSLVGDPWATLGAGLDTLTEPFRGELTGFWNAWLLKKYGTGAKLQAAWAAGLTPTGPGLLSASSKWSIEHQGTSAADLKTDGLSAQATVGKTDGTDWHVQIHQTGLDLKNDAAYTVTFRAKADTARTLPVAASLDQADWHNVGLDTNAALTTDWKPFSYVFTVHDTVPSHVRLAFTLGNQIGTVWIDALQIHSGMDGAGLPPGQSLTTKTVAIPASALKVQHDDWIAFLAATERAYAEEMRGYLKNTLKVHANVICSQISWGGLTGLSREANMDFADNHAYWQHPRFPHKQWDANDWTMPNTPMVSELAHGGGGTLRDLAEYRVAGKPYTVSEYNHPAPSDYRAECLPELATFAAFQDWDAVYLFDYGPYGVGAQNDKINGYFGIGSDPAKTAFLPAAAMIFRFGLVRAAFFGDNKFLSNLASRNQSEPMEKLWRDAGKGKLPNIFSSQLAVRSGPPVGMQYSGGKPPPILVTGTASNSLFLMDGYGAAVLSGYLGGRTFALKNGIVTFPKFSNNFAAMTLTDMATFAPYKRVVGSQDLLLTLVGKVENLGMDWNADRTSVGSQWGTGPTQAEGIPAMVNLNTNGLRSVWALDGTGAHREKVPASYVNGVLTFTVGPQFKTVWYAVEK